MNITPTEEQQAIIEAAKTGANLCIQAGAGAAKTTTCRLISKEITHPSLYVSFDSETAKIAREVFDSHVTCKTMHSVAYQEIGKFYRKRLQSSLDKEDTKKTIEGYKKEYLNDLDMVYAINEAITAFCRSSHFLLTNFLSEYLEVEDKDLQYLIKEHWGRLINRHETTSITHDVYLKLFQLTKPSLPYSVIYLDEAQDSNPVTLDIFLRQKHAQRIVVGDHYQSIYQWRGAINAFDNIPDSFKQLYLTESFRFTQEIADKANKVLSLLGSEHLLTGRATKPDVDSFKNKAILVRTNISLLSYLANAVENGEKVYVLGSLSDLWSKMYHVQSLYHKERPKYPCRELTSYKTYAELLEAAETQVDLNILINQVIYLSKRFNGIHKAISSIRKVITNDKENCSYTLSTIHKSKGKEWDSVYIDADIITSEIESIENLKDILEQEQTGNLLYVAITRAKYALSIPENIQLYV